MNYDYSAVAHLDRTVHVSDEDGRPSSKHVSDLREETAIVFLGEPGIGKSQIFDQEAQAAGTRRISVRALLNGVEPPPGDILFLDALDEFRIDGSERDKIYQIANAIKRSGKTKWRLACRSEDWRHASDLGAFQEVMSDATIVVATIQPLDVEEAEEILAAFAETDPSSFLRKAQQFAASAFTRSPLSLKLLHRSVATGGAWPSTRFDLFRSATLKLASEHDPRRNGYNRPSPDQILGVAGKICLLLLISGKAFVSRSNAEQDQNSDGENLHYWDVGVDWDSLDSVLDTALLRGEGERFEPIHRTVAEFLAARALNQAVFPSTLDSTTPLPTARALSLITAPDGGPPSELRGLFAWFAVHAADRGRDDEALELIESDPETILLYGDAAVYSARGRRVLLETVSPTIAYGRDGSTAIGSLAGEDLDAVFADILAAPENSRIGIVLEAITGNSGATSRLANQLRDITLAEGRPFWQRRRALLALLTNGMDRGDARQLFDTLGSAQTANASELRVQLFGHLYPDYMDLIDLRTVLAEFTTLKSDDVLGKLMEIQLRLKDTPCPEIFDIPLNDWLRIPEGDRLPIDLKTLLDAALEAAILRNINSSAETIHRWLRNRYPSPWPRPKSEVIAAIQRWLNVEPDRETKLFDTAFNALDVEECHRAFGWLQHVTSSNGSPILIDHIFYRAMRENDPQRIDCLIRTAIAHASRRPELEPLYWQIYEALKDKPDKSALFEELTVSTIEDWKRDEILHNHRHRLEAVAEKERYVNDLSGKLHELSTGTRAWRPAAEIYFSAESDPQRGDGVEALRDATSPAIADAIVQGWTYLATAGNLCNFTIAKLAEADATNRGYLCEEGAAAGINILLSGDTFDISTTPLAVAISILRNAGYVAGVRVERLLDFAYQRLALDPIAGTQALYEFWTMAIDQGANSLSGLRPDVAGHIKSLFCDALVVLRRVSADLVGAARHAAHAAEIHIGICSNMLGSRHRLIVG